MRILIITMSLSSILSFAVEKLPSCPVFWGLNKYSDVVDEKTGDVAPKSSIFIANDWDPSNAGFDDLLFSKFSIFGDKKVDLNQVSLKLIFSNTVKGQVKETSTSFKTEFWDKTHSFIKVKDLDLSKELAKFGASRPKSALVEIAFDNRSLCQSRVTTIGEVGDGVEAVK